MSQWFKKLFLVIGILIIIMGSDYFLAIPKPVQSRCALRLETKTLTVGTKHVVIEIADDDRERECGLSFRGELGEYEGMLFAFENKGIYPFWMKDMNFPLDIIWIRDDFSIAGFLTATPSSFPELFYPEEEIQYVLEMNAGMVKKLKISTNEKIYWQ